MALKYLNFVSLFFYQPQMRFFDNDIVSGIFRRKMDMAYPCEKKQKVLPACVVKKNREVFPSEQYCGLKIYEKFN